MLLKGAMRVCLNRSCCLPFKTSKSALTAWSKYFLELLQTTSKGEYVTLLRQTHVAIGAHLLTNY